MGGRWEPGTKTGFGFIVDKKMTIEYFVMNRDNLTLMANQPLVKVKLCCAGGSEKKGRPSARRGVFINSKVNRIERGL